MKSTDENDLFKKKVFRAKLTDIIECSDPWKKLVWAVIIQEFDTLLKPIGDISNQKLKDSWIESKADALDWIISDHEAMIEENKEKLGQYSGLTFKAACEYVGVTPCTLKKIYKWAVERDFHYFPVSVEFKSVIAIDGEDEVEIGPIDGLNPSLENPLPDDLLSEEGEVLYATDSFALPKWAEEDMMPSVIIQSFMSTASMDME